MFPKPPPPPINRPKLAAFIWARGLELKDVAGAIQCSHEQVRLITLPFGDARRRVPGIDLMARIVEWTAGDVTPADFYPPDLNGEAAQPEAAE